MAFALVVFLAVAWEVYWVHEYGAAPRPDYEMRTVAALFFGWVLPVVLTCATAIIVAVNHILQRR